MEAMVVPFDGKDVDEPFIEYMGEILLNVAKTKKVLRIALDNKLCLFNDHIGEKTKTVLEHLEA